MLMSCTHVFIALYFPVLVVLFWNFVNKLLVHSALKSYKGAILESSHSIQAFFSILEPCVLQCLPPQYIHVFTL